MCYSKIEVKSHETEFKTLVIKIRQFTLNILFPPLFSNETVLGTFLAYI